MDFNALHHQHSPLLIANVWDAGSALAAQQAGYYALGTSSAAMAAMLGYEDGEGMGFDELLFIVARIRAVTARPLSVDVEAGYGDTTKEIIKNIQRLVQLGVVGINLEDSRVADGVRQLEDASLFADKCQAIAQSCPDIFLNVRTDTFLLNTENALRETVCRGQLYADHGAKGFFVPGVTQSEDIAAIARNVALPLNVMCLPGLPDFGTLATLGVRRISMGNVVYSAMQAQLKDLLCTIQEQRTFAGVLNHENHR
ncbi:isocitrate lyase/phosphoenolpyruvate mutase family protein [Chimaeribacter californicus]|uniref:Isocitrate lyase/phosphoenolpyruvate mutase family protein n=1 Tax=Chimaeribacter californicus TaxID=2060067 RepID=A0A2N5EBZ9_9GAMM|nr:isocitrate lyase/phosphoenolpyruvate mutase family protein [Chimaeribacter californicus]PLR39614.1 isocitrate lyase/phosphoenolpyruvate mutase family protein [Chimaeribacter californicus]